MKIVYLSVIESYDEASGIQKKIKHQVEALQKLNVDIDAFIITKTGNNKQLYNRDINTNCLQYKPINENNFIAPFIRKIPLVGKYYIEMKFYQKMHEIIKQYDDVNIIYLRNLRGSPYLIGFAKKYNRKIIIEHQSKELDEFIANGFVLRYLLELICKPFVYNYVRGCVCVTEEIEAYQKKRFKKKLSNSKVITNSFEVASVKVRKAPIYDHKSIRLLFIGSISSWHGIDRVIYGLKNYQGNKKIDLYIIGDGEYTQNLKDLVFGLNLNGSVHFMGPKESDELDWYFDHCHVAIGSLGIHRLDMIRASTLKVREYLSRGIPFVLSYIDSDIDNDVEVEPFVLKVSPDDRPIKIEEVIKFVEKVYNLEDHPIKIRNYALRKVDSAIKAAELKELFLYIDSMK